MKLLLVEDEIEARDSLARALTRAKYDVRVASSVEEASPLLEVDLAVVDVKLGADDHGGLDRGRRPGLPAPSVAVQPPFSVIGDAAAASLHRVRSLRSRHSASGRVGARRDGLGAVARGRPARADRHDCHDSVRPHKE